MELICHFTDQGPTLLELLLGLLRKEPEEGEMPWPGRG